MRSEITKLVRNSQIFCEKYKEDITDIILFGSIMRGKEKPQDIDILIIFNKNINKDIEYGYRKHVSKKYKNISVISKTQKNICDSSFAAREAILFEGYSLIKKEFVASRYGFISLGKFLYHTKSLSNTKKTRFYYALNGRGASQGIINLLNAIKLSDNIINVPLDKIETAKGFFEYWNIEYIYVPLLIPARLAKKHIISKVS